MENDIELQLEKQLGEMLHPEAIFSYDENGDYWYMNHISLPLPNFLGYVPKWARNNGDSFELMVQLKCFPILLSGGVAVMDGLGEQRIAEEMFNDHGGSNFDVGTDEEKSRMKATRIVILRAAIHKQTELNRKKRRLQ